MVGSYSEVHCDRTRRRVIEDLPQPPSPQMVMAMGTGVGGWAAIATEVCVWRGGGCGSRDSRSARRNSRMVRVLRVSKKQLYTARVPSSASSSVVAKSQSQSQRKKTTKSKMKKRKENRRPTAVAPSPHLLPGPWEAVWSRRRRCAGSAAKSKAPHAHPCHFRARPWMCPEVTTADAATRVAFLFPHAERDWASLPVFRVGWVSFLLLGVDGEDR